MDEGKEKKKKKKEAGKEQRDDNSAIQIPRLIGLVSPPRSPRALLSRRGRSARRLIKFSGNQICHSAVRF